MTDSGETLKNDKHKWTDDEVKYLIDLYESKPCLWDIFSKDYAKRDIREKAFNDISDEPGISIDELIFILIKRNRKRNHYSASML